MVTYGKVELYEEADTNTYSGYMIAGVEFKVIEIQGDWLRIEVTPANFPKWQRWIQTGGAYLPEGEVPPTPETIIRFPKEIVLANGQLVIENIGTKFGINVTQYAERPDGTIAQGSEAVNINSDYVNTMFAKYNTGGNILKVFFYDDIDKFPYGNEGKVSQNYYRYGKEAGNTIVFYLGVYQTFDINRDDTRISFELHMLGIEAFLEGDYDVITKGSAPRELYPKELDALAYPGKFSIVG